MSRHALADGRSEARATGEDRRRFPGRGARFLEAVDAGSGGVTLTVDGRDFVSTSTVKIGERLLRTELVSPAQLRATIPAELVKSVGTYPVKVVHRMRAGTRRMPRT